MCSQNSINRKRNFAFVLRHCDVVSTSNTADIALQRSTNEVFAMLKSHIMRSASYSRVFHHLKLCLMSNKVTMQRHVTCRCWLCTCRSHVVPDWRGGENQIRSDRIRKKMLFWMPIQNWVRTLETFLLSENWDSSELGSLLLTPDPSLILSVIAAFASSWSPALCPGRK